MALLTCSSKADDAEEDHHPIMLAYDGDVRLVSVRCMACFGGSRYEGQGMDVGSGTQEDRAAIVRFEAQASLSVCAASKR